LCVLSGCKTVTLFPPSDTPFLYPQPVTSDSANHSLVPLSVMKKNSDSKATTAASATTTATAGATATDNFPLFGRARGLRCTLARGDVLFLPQGWWHQVDSYPSPRHPAPTIAVNLWWRSEFALSTAALPPPSSASAAPAAAAAASSQATTLKPNSSPASAAPNMNSFFLRSVLMKLVNERKQELLGLSPTTSNASSAVKTALTAAERLSWIQALLASGGASLAPAAASDSVMQLLRSVHPLLLLSLLAQVCERSFFFCVCPTLYLNIFGCSVTVRRDAAASAGDPHHRSGSKVHHTPNHTV
jgi:hypothetical protein